jgi:hypothetical protein
VSGNGRLGPKNALGEGVVGSVVAAGNGHSYLAVMTRSHPDWNYDLTGRVIRGNGSLGPVFSIDPLTNGSGGVAAAGNGFLVSSPTDGGTLFPVAGTGNVGSPILLSLASTTLNSATNGRTTLVAWIPGFGDLPFAVNAQFVVDGALQDPVLQIAPTTAGDGTALAWDGRSYWSVWTVRDEQSDHSRAFMRAISTTGVLGPVSQVTDEECQEPSLASNGHQQLLLACHAFTNRYREVTVSTRLIDTSRASRR